MNQDALQVLAILNNTLGLYTVMLIPLFAGGTRLLIDCINDGFKRQGWLITTFGWLSAFSVALLIVAVNADVIKNLHSEQWEVEKIISWKAALIPYLGMFSFFSFIIGYALFSITYDEYENPKWPKVVFGFLWMIGFSVILYKLIVTLSDMQ